MEKTKKVTKNASISIPKDMRIEAGIFPGMAVDVKNNGTTITIAPHIPTCHFCGSVEGVVNVKSIDIEICRHCAEKIIRTVNGNG